MFTSETAKLAGKKSKRRKPTLVDDIMAKTQRGNKVIDELVKIVDSKKASNSDKIKASTLILAYGFGKPTQIVDNKVGGTVKFKWVDAPKMIENNTEEGEFVEVCQKPKLIK